MWVALRVAAALVLAAFSSPGPLAAAVVGADPPRSVLVLNSYHQGYGWSDNEIEGILEGLELVRPEIALMIEHLDLKRFSGEDYETRLKGFLAGKYRNRPIDLAVILDNPAFDLILSHRDEILPGVPIVFAGINNFRPEMLKGQDRITGIAEVEDHARILALALRLHPGTRRVLAVHDYTASGLAVCREMEAVLPAFRDLVQVSFNAPATYEEMAAQIAEQPPDSLVLILSFATDRAGKTLTPARSTAALTARARVPVYAMHETRLGHGIVGGLLIGGAEHGRRAAALALRVLAGEDPASIPVEIRSASRPMFDYLQLQRFDIPLDALPAGSTFVNRPASFYELHKSILWPAGCIIALLLALIGSLLVVMQRKKRAEAALRDSEARYRIVAENTYAWEYWIDPRGQFLYVSPSCRKISGYAPEEFLKRAELWRDIIHPDDRPIWEAHRCAAFDQQQADEICLRIRRPDGEVRWVSHECAPVLESGGRFLGTRGSNRDVTDRMRMQTALRESEARFRVLYEKAPLPYQSLDENGNFIEVNQAFLDVLGYARADVIGRNFSEFLAPDRADHFKQNFPGSKPSAKSSASNSRWSRKTLPGFSYPSTGRSRMTVRAASSRPTAYLRTLRSAGGGNGTCRPSATCWRPFSRTRPSSCCWSTRTCASSASTVPEPVSQDGRRRRFSVCSVARCSDATTPSTGRVAEEMPHAKTARCARRLCARSRRVRRFWAHKAGSSSASPRK